MTRRNTHGHTLIRHLITPWVLTLAIFVGASTALEFSPYGKVLVGNFGDVLSKA